MGDRFGALSAEVGHELDVAIEAWAETHVRPVALPRKASGMVLDLEALFGLGVGDRLGEVAVEVEAIRATWNSAVSEVNPGPATRIPEGQLSDVPWLLFERGFFVAADSLVSKQRKGHYHTSQGVSVSRRAV